MSQRDKPNVEWTLEIGPLNPKKQKKRKPGEKPITIAHSMSKLKIFGHLNTMLGDITDVCSGREIMFAKKWKSLKVVKIEGRNVLRVRFFIESPSSIKRLERLKPGFKRLRAQHDYSK